MDVGIYGSMDVCIYACRNNEEIIFFFHVKLNTIISNIITFWGTVGLSGYAAQQGIQKQ